MDRIRKFKTWVLNVFFILVLNRKMKYYFEKTYTYKNVVNHWLKICLSAKKSKIYAISNVANKINCNKKLNFSFIVARLDM